MSPMPRRLARFIGTSVVALLVAAVCPASRAADEHPAPQLAEEVAKLTADGRYAVALQKAEELSRVVREKAGAQSPHYAAAISWMASLYQSTSRLADAEPLLAEALRIYEAARPSGHPDIATAINNLGFQHQASGRYEEAEQHYKRALDLRERAVPADEAAIADSLNNVAQIYKRQSRLAEAEPLLLRSYEIRERLLGSEHPAVAQSIQNLASLLELNNRFADAEPMLRKMLALRQRTQRTNHPDIAAATGKLAQNLYKQQRFAEAETLFRNALSMQRNEHATASAKPAANSFASVNAAGQAQGDQQGPRLGDGTNVVTLFDFALNQMEQDKLAEAEDILRQVLASNRQTLTPTHPTLANTLMAAAEVASRQGRHAEALQTIRPASEIRIARGTEDDLSRLTYLKHVRFAWRAYAANLPDSRTRQILDEALVVGQRAAQTDTAAAITRMAARLSAQDKGLNELVRERDDLDGLQVMLEQQLNRVMALPKEQRGENENDMRRILTTIAKRLADIMDRDLKTRFPEYFNLLKPEPLNASQISALLGADEALVQVLCGYDETYVWAVTKETASWHRVDLDPERMSRMVGQLRASLDIEDLKSNLGKGGSLFDLGLAHELYRRLLEPVANVVARKPNLMVVPCGALTSLPFHLLVTEPPAVAKPALKDLTTAYKNAKWLARGHAISVLPSVPSLKNLRLLPRQVESRRPLIGFANPVFARAADSAGARTASRPASRGSTIASSTRSLSTTTTRTGYASFWKGQSADLDALRTGLPALPETENEIKAVARSLGGAADLRIGPAASETAVKRAQLGDYQIVYFATHGLVAGEVKGLGEPALALSLPEAASELDDGLLTASEVAQLRLNADWVVLAACNTAAGETPGAEALSGLARAFFHAGARALLVSHWRVGSKAAARLTTSTFDMKRRDASIGRAEALRRAMLAFAADTKDPWNTYPGFWAPFTVVGEGLK
jgi:CHAT domain-containing protein